VAAILNISLLLEAVAAVALQVVGAALVALKLALLACPQALAP